MGLAFLFLLALATTAFIFGFVHAKKYISGSRDKYGASGVIVASAFTLGLIAVVVPYWRHAGGEFFSPSIWGDDILIIGVPSLFIISKFARMFGEERSIQNLSLFGVGAMLAIPMTVLLHICLDGYLVKFFQLTPTS